MNFAGMIDNANPAHPRLISIFPTPVPPKDAPYKDFCDKGGRFGPHNTSQEIHNPAIQQPGNLIDIAWFNAGAAHLRHQRPAAAERSRLFHAAGAAERARPIRARMRRKIDWSEEIAVDARGYIYHERRQVGTLHPALYGRGAEIGGPRVISLTRRATLCVRAP